MSTTKNKRVPDNLISTLLNLYNVCRTIDLALLDLNINYLKEDQKNTFKLFIISNKNDTTKLILILDMFKTKPYDHDDEMVLHFIEKLKLDVDKELKSAICFTALHRLIIHKLKTIMQVRPLIPDKFNTPIVNIHDRSEHIKTLIDNELEQINTSILINPQI